MNIFAKEKKQIILRREDLVKNTRLLSKELSKLFFGNTHFFEHYQNFFELVFVNFRGLFLCFDDHFLIFKSFHSFLKAFLPFFHLLSCF